jgi:hypothetical protein
MKFAYEDLSSEQFEQLILMICQRLLGMGVQGFSTGPDGGRDGKFTGTAETYPSKAEPWRGTTILQGKHTNGINRHCAEKDFFNPGSEDTVIGKEIPRIKRLRTMGELHNYMVFTNRRLAGGVEAKIRKHISTRCDLSEQNVSICGLEQLELWLKRYSDIPATIDLDPIDSPLILSPDDLSVVVQALHDAKDAVAKITTKPPVRRVSYEAKNKANGMTATYADALRKRYLKDTVQIGAFLAAPENEELLSLYNSVTEEFQLKIIANRKDHQTFDKVMEYLVSLLFGRDAVLRQVHHRRITRAVLFHMYWFCDIGEVPDAKA